MTRSRLAAWGASLLLCAGAAAAGAQSGNPGGPINDNLGETDYGVCRGIDPRCFHDWPRAATTRYRIMVFSRTGASRHANLGKPLAPGLNPPLGEDNVAQRGMVRIAAENGWDVDYTEDVAQMADLKGYNAVIFLSTSREVLDDTAKTALRQYVRAGGGFVAVHNAFGTLYNWPWYEGLIGGTNFYDHLPAREADVVVVDSKDVSTRDLPKRWRFRDEWYNLVPFPTRVRFLATVDETSWPKTAPLGTNPAAIAAAMGERGAVLPQALVRPRYSSVIGSHPGHGSFHPVAWCQYYDGGKVWATTLGHESAAFEKNATLPGAAQFQGMLVHGIRSVMGQEPFCK